MITWMIMEQTFIFSCRHTTQRLRWTTTSCYKIQSKNWLFSSCNNQHNILCSCWFLGYKPTNDTKWCGNKSSKNETVPRNIPIFSIVKGKYRIILHTPPLSCLVGHCCLTYSDYGVMLCFEYFDHYYCYFTLQFDYVMGYQDSYTDTIE
jgi:hypothetical protein